MPDRRLDWRKQASRKLADSKLSAAERDEVARELAGYLEDLCTDAPARGLDDPAAAQHAAAELHEDKHLGAHLYRARKENTVNDRTKQLWLPGLTMLLATIALLAFFEFAGFHAYYGVLWLRGPVSLGAAYWRFSMYNAWLFPLPFLGAAGAYWSRRAGSGRGMQAVAGLSPLLVFLAAFAAMVHFSFALDGVPPARTLLPALAVAALRWVVIPGAALLSGVLPFLLSAESRRHAAHRLPS
ncbi:MAG: hypothetical protein ACRD4A_10635 [Candidatus Acidiferrales bacterium]